MGGCVLRCTFTCKCKPSFTDGFVSVSKSPLMWIVMLVLAGSISRTLCPSSLKLRRVSVSEATGVWIITSNAFTVHAWGKGHAAYCSSCHLSHVSKVMSTSSPLSSLSVLSAFVPQDNLHTHPLSLALFRSLFVNPSHPPTY